MAYFVQIRYPTEPPVPLTLFHSHPVAIAHFSFEIFRLRVHFVVVVAFFAIPLSLSRGVSVCARARSSTGLFLHANAIVSC